jgi:hypothetical protein
MKCWFYDGARGRLYTFNRSRSTRQNYDRNHSDHVETDLFVVSDRYPRFPLWDCPTLTSTHGIRNVIFPSVARIVFVSYCYSFSHRQRNRVCFSGVISAGVSVPVQIPLSQAPEHTYWSRLQWTLGRRRNIVCIVLRTGISFIQQTPENFNYSCTVIIIKRILRNTYIYIYIGTRYKSYINL